MIAYPKQAKELAELLQKDQVEKRAIGRAYFADDVEALRKKQVKLAANSEKRAARMLQILDEIGEPSITNIGVQAAQAISALAVHASPQILKTILAKIQTAYERQPKNVDYMSIPSLTDWLLIAERKPQCFGTIWLFDADKQPYLPTVEDFQHINERRAVYDIGPLRWPKSLAIPEAEQPWLTRPLAELVMRDPTDEEYRNLSLD